LKDILVTWALHSGLPIPLVLLTLFGAGGYTCWQASPYLGAMTTAFEAKYGNGQEEEEDSPSP
jgi:hypothetical protein